MICTIKGGDCNWLRGSNWLLDWVLYWYPQAVQLDWEMFGVFHTSQVVMAGLLLS